IGRLTPIRRLYPLRVPRTSALPAASSRFPVARDTLAVRLTLPLTGRVEDFHLRVGAPCRAHQRKGGPMPAFDSTAPDLRPRIGECRSSKTYTRTSRRAPLVEEPFAPPRTARCS